jgi:hypothetical protein
MNFLVSNCSGGFSVYPQKFEYFWSVKSSFSLGHFLQPMECDCVVEWLGAEVGDRDVGGSGPLESFWGKKIWGI